MDSISFESIGTRWQIDLLNGRTSDKDKIKNKILNFLDDFDKTYSRFRDDSLVSRISQKKGTYEFPKSASEIFHLYKRLYNITNGQFSPLAGSLLSESGYDAKYSFRNKEKTPVKQWDEVINYADGKLEVKEPVILDFGAAGKGYAIDKISNILEDNKVSKYIIDAGGDIKIKSNKKTRIGLEHPENLGQVIGALEIKNGSICASSGNKRKWGKYHHIMDLKNLESVENIISTWVIAENTFEADTLSTCLFLVSPDKLKGEFEFEYLILYPNYTIDKSENFNAEIFYNK